MNVEYDLSLFGVTEIYLLLRQENIQKETDTGGFVTDLKEFFAVLVAFFYTLPQGD